MNYLLSVGVNKYKTPGNDLRGCVNDVYNIKSALSSFCGISVMGIKSLTDQNATKERILMSLKDMIDMAREGDHLIYHHSSHGSQVEDTSGDEFDMLDEILCPYDFDWNGTYITDDELRAIIGRLRKNVTLDVILDCCHSGTGLREIKPNTVLKYIPPPVVCRSTTIPSKPPRVKKLLGIGLPSKVTLWAGCRSDQTSADAKIGGDWNGAMTFFFCQEIRKAKGIISRAKLYSNIKKALREGDYDQLPQLECGLFRRYKTIFN